MLSATSPAARSGALSLCGGGWYGPMAERLPWRDSDALPWRSDLVRRIGEQRQSAYRPEKAGNVTGLSTVADRAAQGGLQGGCFAWRFWRHPDPLRSREHRSRALHPTDTPARTNRSHEDKLYGWCGSYNNVSTNACGAWRVTRIAKNGRMLISKLTGDELATFLEEMGFPDLTPLAGDSVTI